MRIPRLAPRRLHSWRTYLIALIGSVVLMFMLPGPSAFAMLLVVIVLALGISAYDSGLTIARIGRGLRQLGNGTVRFAGGEPHRALRSRLVAWAALGCMSLAAIDLGGRTGTPLVLILAGGAALGLSLAYAPRLDRLARPTDTPLVPRTANALALLSGVGLLAVLTAVNAGKLLGWPLAAQVSLHVEFLLLAGGIGLVVWGFADAPRPAFDAVRTRLSRRAAMPLLAIFALALGLRVWGLETTIRNSVDEAVVIEGIHHAGNASMAGLVTQVSDRLSVSQLFPYWQRLAVTVLGPTLTGLRLTNAVVGALTVLAVYALARSLFDRKVALVAALLLATFPPHLHFSRIAMAHIADPLFGTLALMFLVRGLKHNRRGDWALAGACLGLTQYFFEGGRLLFPPLFLASVVLMALCVSGHLRAHWRGLVVTLLTMVFVITPIYFQIFAFDRDRASRMADSGVGLTYFTGILADGVASSELNALAERLIFPFTVYVNQPEIGNYYGGSTALLLGPLVPVFLLGVSYLVLRFRSPALLLLVWLVLAGLGNALMRETAVYPRFIVVLPALALVLAVGLGYGLPLLAGRRPALLAAALAVLTFAIGMLQVSYYFGVHVPAANAQLRRAAPYDGIDGVLRAAELPQDRTQVVMIGQAEYHNGVTRVFDTFLSSRGPDYGLVSVRAHEVTDAWLTSLPHDRAYVFLVAPDSDAVVDRLRGQFQLSEPQFSRDGAIPPEKAYVLYQGTALTGPAEVD